MWRRVLLPWNAAALPGIMAGALQESKLDAPVSFHEGRAAGKQQGTAEARGRGVRKPSSVAEARGGGAEKPNRGLTLRLTGVPKARPS